MFHIFEPQYLVWSPDHIPRARSHCPRAAWLLDYHRPCQMNFEFTIRDADRTSTAASINDIFTSIPPTEELKCTGGGGSGTKCVSDFAFPCPDGWKACKLEGENKTCCECECECLSICWGKLVKGKVNPFLRIPRYQVCSVQPPSSVRYDLMCLIRWVFFTSSFIQGK